jgi:20S proteasome alpha/beta subunit
MESINRAQEAPKTGTTIVACEYAGGIVIGADTRVSTGTFYAFLFSSWTDLSSHLFLSSLLTYFDINRNVHFQPSVG